MNYIQIMSVPVPRESAPVPPAAAFAARLVQGTMDTVELRYHKGIGKIQCYLGLPDSFPPARAVQLLANDGYISKVSTPPAGGAATQLLQRNLNETILGTSVRVSPAMVESATQQYAALFHALCQCDPGSGLSIFIQKEALPPALVTGCNDQPAFAELIKAPCLYKMVLCAYGPSAPWLASETAYSIPGLKTASIAPTPLSPSSLFQLLSRNPMGYRNSALAPISSYFQPYELTVMTDLQAAALPSLPCGLQYNLDTIPGPPLPYPQQPQQLLIGSSAQGDPLYLPFSQLKHNTCVVAPIGAGKGNFLFSLMVQLQKASIPTLVLEASKQEYHYLQRVTPHMRTWRPDSFLLNPFELPPGLTLAQYRPSLHQMMRTAFAMPSPLDDYFNTTLERCFAKYGYTENSRQGDPGTAPWGLHEFITEFNHYLTSSGYSQKTKSDMTQAGLGRLQAPLSENAQIFDTTHSIPIDLLTKGVNLLQLNDLTSVDAKQFFATMVLIMLSAYLKTQLSHSAPDGTPRLVIILEESHQLLRGVKDKSGEASTSFADDFLSLMLTLRSVGCCFVLSTQSADLLPVEFIKSCGNRIFLGDALNQCTVANSVVKMDNAALDHLYLITPGHGVFTSRGLSRPYYFETANIIDKILQTEPLAPQNDWILAHQREMTNVFSSCSQCPMKTLCTQATRQDAKQKALQLHALFGAELNKALSRPDSTERSEALYKCYHTLLKFLAPLPDTVRTCAQIQFLRLFNRSGEHTLPIHKTRQQMDTLINMTAKDGANNGF